MKILIIGGVAGGATAAARLRRLSEEDEIILFERDEFISYANCGLPYYIGGVIKEKEKLQVQTVQGMSKRYNLDIRVRNEVISIDKKSKTVAVKKLDGGEEYTESYDKLILSCGAKPIKPPIKGIERAENVFTLRNIGDTYKIRDFAVSGAVKNAVVIGGGFIGVEVAENLREAGLNVTLVEKLDQTLRPLDFEMVQLVHRELNNHGVETIFEDGISAFENNGKSVLLESGRMLNADMTMLAIGVAPENTLAKSANLKLGARGHVIVDEGFSAFDAETDKPEPDIFAIGDMIEVINPLDNSSYSVPLAWGANRQGRLVADRINGLSVKKSSIIGASVLKVFDLTVASVGANEAMLKAKNINYTAIHAHRANHASYYPDSSNIALKLLFDKETGRIYGAQAIGREGTEKRIDVISTAIRLGGSAFDLSDLELCYAPPYSSAKDPVNILGYIAENVAQGVYENVYADEIDKIVSDGGYLIDVRTPFEYGNGHIEGSVNLELDSLRENLDKIKAEKDAPIYVTCQVGLRAYMAIKILKAAGFKNLYNLSGGYSTYTAYKYKPCVKNLKGCACGNSELNGADTDGQTYADNLNGKTQDNKAFNDLGGGKVMNTAAIKEIDVTGIQCPGPLMATYQALMTMREGEILKITATDGGFAADIENWCSANGHNLKSLECSGGKYTALVEKGSIGKNCLVEANQKNATIVVFSGELDKALASMIIAQGAAAQGKNVTMFFTFWGLNALRKPEKVKVSKNIIEKLFGIMMPRGAEKLPLSNMNMGGMGSKMIKSIMRKKHVDDLPSMIKKAQEVGVKMIACTMSMDLMGIKKEELIDGIGYAGVATYISKNENVGTTLFI